MPSNVFNLPPSEAFTPEQALASALNDAHNLEDVIIFGYDTSGELFVRSSRMDRKESLFLCENLRNYIMSV